MAYPEGMSIEVSFSPTLQRFTASALPPDSEDAIFSFRSKKLSEALEELAAEIRDRFEQ
jgi:predicted RNA-binding Zn ribbon-like protein